MSLSATRKANFERLRNAVKANKVALLECRGEDDTSLLTICTVTDLGHDLFELQPFAILLDEKEVHESRIILKRRADVRLN